MAQTKPEGWDKVLFRGCRYEPSQPEVKVMVPILTCVDLNLCRSIQKIYISLDTGLFE